MADRITVYNSKGDKLVLGPNDYLTSGGEGAIYARGNEVFKIYLDPTNAIRARVPEKLPLLQALQHPGIAAPRGALCDKNGQFLGVVFPRVEGEALCKLFTNTWRDAHGFGLPQSEEVIRQMQSIVAHAHTHQALLVDGNELNYLVQGTRAHVIDVDSWALPGFPGTAIMPSIKDPQITHDFNQGSDWFAWAIVTFQLWTGIHPFKGTHPDFARAALEARMRARVSVFDAKVRIPQACRPMQDIPSALLQWYRDVFTSTQRSAPPSDYHGRAAPALTPRHHVVQTLHATLRQDRLALVASARPGVNGFVYGAREVFDGQTRRTLAWLPGTAGASLAEGLATLVRTNVGTVYLSLTPGCQLDAITEQGIKAVPLLSTARKLWQQENRVFALVEGVSNGLVELDVTVLAGKPIISIAKQWPISALASEGFRYCLIQDCLGMPFIAVLEGKGLDQARAPALKGLRVIDALALDGANVWVTAQRKSDGELVRLRLARTAMDFEVQEESLVADAGLNGARLDSGVGVIHLNGDLRISKGANSKQIANCGLSDSARLLSLGSGLGVVQDGAVYRLSLG